MILRVLSFSFLFWNIQGTSSFLLAYNKINGTNEYEDAEAQFGPGVIDGGLLGVLVFAEPYDGCREMKRSPYPTAGEMGNITMPSFALIERGSCDFAEKVLNAQNAGFSAAIVYNDKTNMVVRMGTDKPQISKEIFIPSVFIGLDSAKELNSSFLYNKPDAYIRIMEGSFDPLQYYLVPFIIVISICFVSLLLFMLVRCLRDRRRTRRNRLSLARLKQLPVKRFQKGNEYDVCAICLDEYDEGDKLRILPCKHAYHCKCVDPWLTSSKRVCPLCKQKVLSDDESSDSEDNDSDNERTPLISTSAASSPNAPRWATGFSRHNPIVRAIRRNLRRARRRDSSSTDDTDSVDTLDTDEETEAAPLLLNEAPLARAQEIGENSRELLLRHNEVQQQPAITEVEPCCSHSNDANALIHGAEVYIVKSNRRSTASITVISDGEMTPPRSPSSPVSQDYQSADESQTPEANVPYTSVESDQEASNSENYQSIEIEDDDIIVLAHGSHQSNTSHTEEV